MGATDLEVRHLPAELAGELVAELVADPGTTTMLKLPGRTPVWLIAAPDRAGVTTLCAIAETWIETLWPPQAEPAGSGPAEFGPAGSGPAGSGPPQAAPRDQGPADPAPGRVDLVPTGKGRALGLIPGQALLALDVLAEDEADRVKVVKPGRRGLPHRLFAHDGRVTGLWYLPDGQTRLAPLTAAGLPRAGDERAGPRVSPGQQVNLVLRDRSGGEVVIAEDCRTGFVVWRQEIGGDWMLVAGDGAGRAALNAGVSCGLLWGDRIVLAAGPTAAVRQGLPGMSLDSELIALDTDGRLRLLAGELRVSAAGLMVPELSASAIMAFGRGRFSHLAIDGAGRLILGVGRSGGQSGGRMALFAIAPDMTVTPLADADADLLGLATAPAGGITAILVRQD